MTELLLHGFGATGVWSLRAKSPVLIGPLGRFNCLVGRNNHGKSSVMKISEYFSQKPLKITEGVSVSRLAVFNEDATDRFPYGNLKRTVAAGKAQGWLVDVDSEHFGYWVHHQSERRSSRLELSLVEGWRQACQRNIDEGYLLRPAQETFQPVARALIPSFRQIHPAPHVGGQPDLDIGAGLIEEIQRWERPPDAGTATYIQRKEQFRSLERFARSVLDDPEAEIEVSTSLEIHVRLNQSHTFLPLKSLGDGINQVIMIAAAAIRHDGKFVCLEEPEIHLHPGLQRKLVRYLLDYTRSQYLVATHSAHFLDTPDARVFHVVHDGTSTQVSQATHARDAARVAQDLGYLASDLLQTNFTVWVEGPADRIYWRRWLSLMDSELQEGVHFSIMSYGGRLLDFIGLASKDVDSMELLESDLVDLLRLGRNCVVICDSDKTSEAAPLHPTVLRLQEEAMVAGSGEVIVPIWARTVENLVDRDMFVRGMLTVYPIAAKKLRNNPTPSIALSTE